MFFLILVPLENFASEFLLQEYGGEWLPPAQRMPPVVGTYEEEKKGYSTVYDAAGPENEKVVRMRRFQNKVFTIERPSESQGL